MNVLVDSDILIEVLRGRDQGVSSQWASLATAGTTVIYSPVTSAEVWAGARTAEHNQIIATLRPLVCAEIDCGIGGLAGEFLLQYSKSHSLRIGDALIAATAVRFQAALWTRNRKHYPMKNLTFH